MSVINQVLNQLEQRGARPAAAPPLVGAVQHTRSKKVMAVRGAGLVR
jgi:hypothetical protein